MLASRLLFRSQNALRLPALLLALVATALVEIAPAAAAPPQATIDRHLPSIMLPLEIDEVIVRDGQLIALGSLGDLNFELPIDLTTLDDGDECPILDLALGPISLDLLGLQVDTSPICLSIDAEPGSGNLLGNLLCGVAHLLDDGLDLGSILDLLEAELGEEAVADLLDGIADLLNAALDEILSPASVVGVSSSQVAAASHTPGHGGADCDILNLAVGPLDLNLLGLDVELDDCDDGPVTVDITAAPGAGNLLGNLLCNLAGLLDSNASEVALANALNRVANAILGLL
jgi:hypothetical protein